MSYTRLQRDLCFCCIGNVGLFNSFVVFAGQWHERVDRAAHPADPRRNRADVIRVREGEAAGATVQALQRRRCHQGDDCPFASLFVTLKQTEQLVLRFLGRWFQRGRSEREEGSLHGRAQRDARCCGGGHRARRWCRTHPLSARARGSQARER